MKPLSIIGIAFGLGLAACSTAAPTSPDSGPATAGCSINGLAVTASALEPGNSCQSCQPSIAISTWTPLPNLTPCNGNGGTYCQGGTCLNACGIEGLVVLSGATNPANACQNCQPELNLNSWTSLPAGSCTDGGSPDAGDAGLDGGEDGGLDGGLDAGLDGGLDAGPPTRCSIDGASVDAGTLSPLTTCQSCQPLSSADGYSPVADGTLCTSGGNVCLAGACTPGCFLEGGFVAPHAFQSVETDVCCNPGLSPLSWTPGFVPLPPLSVANPSAMVSGDIDKDGFSDLLVGTGAGSLAVLYGQPDGGFAVTPFNYTGSSVAGVAIADLDRDGRNDLLYLKDQQVTALLQIQAGVFSTGFGSTWGGTPDASGIWAENTGSSPLALVLGPDFTTSSPVVDSSLQFLSDPAGELIGDGGTLAIGTCAPFELVFGSFSAPKATELAVNCTGWTVTYFTVVAFKNNPPRWVADAVAPSACFASYPAVPGPLLASGDFNGDGYSDLAGGGGSQISYSINPRAAQISCAPGTLDLPAGGNATAVGFAPLKGDGGTQQLVVTDSTNGNLDVFDIYSDAGLIASYPAGKPTAVAVGDFNGDGRPDVAVLTTPANSATTVVQVFQRQCP